MSEFYKNLLKHQIKKYHSLSNEEMIKKNFGFFRIQSLLHRSKLHCDDYTFFMSYFCFKLILK